MAIVVINYRKTVLDQVELDASFTCTKCGSDKWLLNTIETKSSYGFGNMIMVNTFVVCKGCSKRIAKKYQSAEIRQLAAIKKEEFKPSFMERFGLLVITFALFVAVVTSAVVYTVLDHQKTVKAAEGNFAKTYGQDAQQAWIDNIQPGDFLFCNKNYNDPATIFQVKELKPDIVVLTQFEQTVPRAEFENVDKLNQLTLGTGNSHELGISRKDFFRNIISFDDDSRNNMRIQQIRKKK